jgi:formylmethanofuran dehydrogenase subunit E
LTGCTFGKGNLVFRDHGKHVYTFVRRADGTGVRVVVRPDYWSEQSPEHQALWDKINAGQASVDERARFQQHQVQRFRDLLAMPEARLLAIEPVQIALPAVVRKPEYVCCPRCGELVLTNRLRAAGEQQVCRPCAAALDGRP